VGGVSGVQGRSGAIGPGNNASRIVLRKHRSKTETELLEELRGELLLNGEVSWEKLRREVWGGDRYRLRNFVQRLISQSALVLQKRGNQHWYLPGENLWSITIEHLRAGMDVLVCNSERWPGKYQPQCTSCGTLVNRPFDTKEDATKWFWNNHSKGSVAHAS
jgi:hypothetical protein